MRLNWASLVSELTALLTVTRDYIQLCFFPCNYLIVGKLESGEREKLFCVNLLNEQVFTNAEKVDNFQSLKY